MGRFINADGLIGPQGDVLNHNMYAYCQNNPVMYVDPDGEFLVSILVMTVIGAVVGGSISGVIAVLDGVEFNSKEFWGLVGAGALRGGALGAALALGGTGGAIATGKMAGLFGLGKSASIGMTFGTAVGVNFFAGMGGYAIESRTNSNMEFNYGQMVKAGIGQASKAIVNYSLGGVISAVGYWQLNGTMPTAKATGFQGVFIRMGARNVLSPLPFLIIDSMLYLNS